MKQEISNKNTEIHKIKSKNSNLQIRLKNLQDFVLLEQLIKATTIDKRKSMEKADKLVSNLGNSPDGSQGFHLHRENGRFGSLSSFDNYNDEYNNKDDPKNNYY